MPNDLQQTILTAFTEAAGNPTSEPKAANLAGSSLPGDEAGLTSALSQAAQVISAQTQATSANTDAIGRDTQTKAGGGATGETANAISTASQFLGGGLSLMPLFSLFSGLFGGQSEQPAPLVSYSLPQSLNLEATNNYQNVVWGENGLPKAAGGNATSAPQITVQVQAMDSQSFLDHSEDIAQAVRQAMLNMNSLNDVVSNL